MVFENVTLFELHLENSRFSATRGGEGGEDADYESESYDVDESGGRGRSVGRSLGVLLFLVVVGLAVRRYRSGGEDVGSVDETGGVTIEQAAEQ